MVLICCEALAMVAHVSFAIFLTCESSKKSSAMIANHREASKSVGSIAKFSAVVGDHRRRFGQSLATTICTQMSKFQLQSPETKLQSFLPQQRKRDSLKWWQKMPQIVMPNLWSWLFSFQPFMTRVQKNSMIREERGKSVTVQEQLWALQALRGKICSQLSHFAVVSKASIWRQSQL